MTELTAKQIKQFNESALETLRLVPAPAGFSCSEKHTPKGKSAWEPETYEFIFATDAIKITLCLFVQEKGGHIYSLAQGHTNFNTKHGWRTFDQTGIGDSFSVPPQASVSDITEIINKQVQKARDQILKIDTSISVPGLGFACHKTEAEITEMTRVLKAGRQVTVAPGGMGTGKLLTMRRPGGRWARFGTREAPPELKKLFGVDTLWLENFDHD